MVENICNTRMEVMERELIIKFGKDSKLNGIEVGVLRGEVDLYLLNKFPNLTMTGIDPAPVLSFIVPTLLNELETGRFHIVIDKSDNAIQRLKREYDFAFIDGDHDYEQIRRDILNYWQIIKPNGILFGHNIDDDVPGIAHPGVRKAVYEIFSGRQVYRDNDVMWWVHV